MASFFSKNKKKLNRFFAIILNAKTTYILLILIVLIQFILVSFIFFRKDKDNSDVALEQINLQLSKISGQQNLLVEKLNSLQSNLGAIQSQIYRLQTPTNQ